METPAIREATHRQPFRPFSLRLADGRTVPVRHPDFIAVAETGRRVAVFAPDGALSLLEPLLIVSLEYAPDGQQTGASSDAGGPLAG